MKNLLRLFFCTSFCISFASFLVAHAAYAGWNGKILEPATGKDLSFEELVAHLSSASAVILGERHYSEAVQATEAKIVTSVVEKTGLQGKFALGWEFFDYTDQSKIEEGRARWAAGEITGAQFLESIPNQKSNAPYLPVLEAAVKQGGTLVGLNLSRREKSKVVEGGLAALDPQLIPQGFELGSAGYRERFVETMGAHAPKEKLENYFAAQCLTDDVMAFQFKAASEKPLRFLVAGGFHTDYFDGTVARIRVREPQISMALIRIVDASDLTEEEAREVASDPRYGVIGDFVFFVNEPRSGRPDESSSPGP